MHIHRASFEQKVWCVSVIVAASLMALSTFFWERGEYGVNAGTILVLACIFWIPAMIGLFGLLKAKRPIYATLGLLVAIYGCVGGALFGFEGIYTAAFTITQPMAKQVWASHPLQFNLTLFWPGPLFPLSLFVLAIVLGWTKTTPWWVAVLLAIGAVAFPLSRIPRSVWLAHGADLLMLVPSLYLGWQLSSVDKSAPPA